MPDASVEDDVLVPLVQKRVPEVPVFIGVEVGKIAAVSPVSLSLFLLSALLTQCGFLSLSRSITPNLLLLPLDPNNAQKKRVCD